MRKSQQKSKTLLYNIHLIDILYHMGILFFFGIYMTNYQPSQHRKKISTTSPHDRIVFIKKTILNAAADKAMVYDTRLV